ncbi:hypothetical protein ACET7H_12170 [Aeromonas veronii]
MPHPSVEKYRQISGVLLYLREIYRHRVSKTRILSLNPRLGEANAR